MNSLHQLLDRNVTVLTSSRRLAHAVRIAFAAHAQASGRSAWRTPTVLPFVTWLRTQWLEARALDDQAAATMLLTATQTRLIWEQILAASPFAEGLLNPAEAARAAARSYQRLREYLIPLTDLEAFDTPEARALATWSREYERRCVAYSASDETELLNWAWNSQLTPGEPVAIAGFDHMPPAVERLIRRWKEQGRLEQLVAHRRATDVSVVPMHDRDMEIESAARWARRQIETGRTRIAIIVDDLQTRADEIQRTFETVFAPEQRTSFNDTSHPPFVIATSQPLARYSIVDAALRVLDLVRGDADSLVVGRLLRSAFLRGASSEGDARALADVQLRRMQRDVWDVSELERWAGITGCSQLELAARETARLQRELPKRALPSAWSERIHAMLHAIGWPGDRTLTSVEQQTFVKFQSAVAELARLDQLLGEIPFRQVHHELRRLLRDTLFEAETPPALVTIIDPFTVAGMTFNAVWVAGLDATRLPAPLNPDPFIPLPLQRAFAIPHASAELSFAQSRQRLDRILTSADQIVLSWPQHDGDAELQQSPLLSAFATIDSATLEVAETRDPGDVIFAGRPTLHVLQDDHVPTLVARSARGGARILELQSLCPFRAQATLRLHSEPLGRIEPGFQASDRGRLLHRVLQALWSELRSQKGLLSLSEEQLRGRLHELAQRHATRSLSATTRARARLAQLEVEALVNKVMQLLAIDRQRPPFEVSLIERNEPFTIGGLDVQIQPDRVDHVVGRAFLIDYKLGDAYSPRDWLDRWPGRPKQPQLPLYGIAHASELAGLAFATMAPGSVEYRGWSDGTNVAPGVLPYPNGLKRRDNVPPDWDELVQHWQMTLNLLAANFVAGHSSVDPLPQACTYCHLSTFCRIHEAVPMDEGSEGDDD